MIRVVAKPKPAQPNTKRRAALIEPMLLSRSGELPDGLLGGARTLHHPDVAGVFLQDHDDLPGGRPAALLVGYPAVKMLDGKGVSDGLVGACIDPLAQKQVCPSLAEVK
jgi:hypothetical protein